LNFIVVSCFGLYELEYHILTPLFLPLPTFQHFWGPGKLWAEQDVVWLLWELLMILDFIQKHKVIHRDIKPDNIAKHTKVDMIWVAGRNPTLVSHSLRGVAMNLKATTLTYLAISFGGLWTGNWC